MFHVFCDSICAEAWQCKLAREYTFSWLASVLYLYFVFVFLYLKSFPGWRPFPYSSESADLKLWADDACACDGPAPTLTFHLGMYLYTYLRMYLYIYLRMYLYIYLSKYLHMFLMLVQCACDRLHLTPTHSRRKILFHAHIFACGFEVHCSAECRSRKQLR